MAAKLKDDVIRWKKKLERNPDEEYILSVIHRLAKVPITLEILQETHIGKCIRNLSKRDDIVGEKALAVLNKWRLVFASVNDSSSKNKQRSISVKENIHKESSKSSSKYDVSHEKTVEHHQKGTSHHQSKHKPQKNSSHYSYPESSKKYVNGDCNVDSSDESSPSLYTYEKKDASSKYISYDPHSDVSEGYNPECPDLFPGGKSMKKKHESQTVDTYEPSSLKRKFKEQEAESIFENKCKKLKPDSHFNSVHIVENKQEKHENQSFQKDKRKSHTHKVDSLHSKKDSSEKVKPGSNSKKSSHSSDSKKSKSKESNENKTKSSKSKAKLKINCSEEFTSSEVRFEDCLGFNDIVIKKKKSVKSVPSSTPKKAAPVNNKPSSHTPGHAVPTKSSSVQKEKLHVDVPRPKEEAKLEEVDIMSTLPQTLPNYRPLPRVDSLTSKKKEVLSNEEAILYMSSKREKTAVYSGRRTFYTEVPTLLELCTRVLIENIDAIEYLGEMNYFLLKPVLEKCSPAQLVNIENYNPQLLDETHEIWKVHCMRDYKLLAPQENETYRELYLRAHDERERKLKSITANISASMSKSNPVRQVKLAYVDSVAKPPRDVARRQAKNGTALPVSHPVKAGPATKSTPRPVAPVINSIASSSSASTSYVQKKPKVAPLMAKTLKSMKQCFRRK